MLNLNLPKKNGLEILSEIIAATYLQVNITVWQIINGCIGTRALAIDVVGQYI